MKEWANKAIAKVVSLAEQAHLWIEYGIAETSTKSVSVAKKLIQLSDIEPLVYFISLDEGGNIEIEIVVGSRRYWFIVYRLGNISYSFEGEREGGGGRITIVDEQSVRDVYQLD